MVFVQDVSPLLINLPIIISLIAFTRYIIGFKTWKNYSSLALALGYFFIYQYTHHITLSLLIWIVALAAAIGGAIGTRYALRWINMNFQSRIAFMYVGGTTLIIIIGLIYQLFTSTKILADQNMILGAFLIASTIDDLASLLFKKEFPEFMRRFSTTTIIGLIGGLLLTWEWWNLMLATHQELIVLVILIDTMVAAWTNLRLTEYFRFRSIIKK